jgi:hypothetical protein
MARQECWRARCASLARSENFLAHGPHQHQAVHAVADERGLDKLRGRHFDLELRQRVFMGPRSYTIY